MAWSYTTINTVRSSPLSRVGLHKPMTWYPQLVLLIIMTFQAIVAWPDLPSTNAKAGRDFMLAAGLIEW